MKNRLLTILAVTAFSTIVFAQESFTIDEALDYTLQNNVQVKKAQIDKVIADQKVKETIGIGLPQASGQAKYTNYLNIPVQLLPAELIGGPSGTFFPAQFGQQHNGNIGVSVSQLLFNGSYLVGLESAKTYKETTALVEEKTQISLKEGVLMTYAGILATDENIKTLEDNRKVLEKNLNDTKITYKTGLTEFQNVEQLEYSYKNMVTIIANLKRTREKLLSGFKYLMNYPQDKNLSLVSTMDEVIERNKTLVSTTENPDFSNHIDLRLKENQIRINKLLLKLEKSKALPSLSAFFASQSFFQNNTFTMFNTNQKWFNTTMFGVQLDVPIFSGFQRHWKTQQAKLNLEKANLDLEDTRKNLENKASATTVDYENALASYENAKELIDLSSSIYNKQQIKFKEGMGTSFELSQAESQLYDAQTKYYQAALGLIQAKVKLDEALGKL